MAIWYDALPPITITLTSVQWLAVAAAMRVMDDDLLEDEGVLPGISNDLQAAFEVVDGAVSDAFGDDWPVLVTTQERLQEEQDDRDLLNEV